MSPTLWLCGRYYPDTTGDYAYVPDNIQPPIFRDRFGFRQGYSIASSNACFTCERDGS